ncbi:OsmC family protein [Periweissella beninensis]|uniref:OsmC family protein n=1 Tax=Periweissella beninensis TaxID=504936 RepID=A0ABT0VJG7_9LACO|nr:OsmC family protein [Periweissella beninensis]MBM7544278.1 organic hydroperoxide reductase OsmC/OhrA [Periweissella beninensis]MCM2437780.1 OsmC family protein [Periweissella beninensis]MCT4396434.1 dihydroneopterin aldolase [Periweissella beninensis]
MIDKRWQDALYITEVINDEGLEGHTYVPNGLKLKTSSPLNSNPGTNPEQLLGMSLSTCLEATLQAIEREHALPHTAAVYVKVAFVGSKAHYEFLVHAEVSLPGVAPALAQAMVTEVEDRCPVSQLLRQSANYTISLAK